MNWGLSFPYGVWWFSKGERKQVEKSGKIPQTHAVTAKEKMVLIAQLLPEMQRKVLIVYQAPGSVLIYWGKDPGGKSRCPPLSNLKLTKIN